MSPNGCACGEWDGFTGREVLRLPWMPEAGEGHDAHSVRRCVVADQDCVRHCVERAS